MTSITSTPPGRCAAILAGTLAAWVPAQTIAYDIRTTQLAAVASYYQSSSSCGTGVWSPTATINGLTTGGLISCPDYDGWSVSTNPGADHSILWIFGNGSAQTDGMQLLQNYTVAQFSMYLRAFDLWYTTAPNPTLASSFQPLPLTAITGVQAAISGNSVVAVPPATWAGPAGVDYRVTWAPVRATAIKLHTPPLAGSYSGNSGFVVSEVSFRTAATNSFASIAPGCTGSRGVPTLAAAPGTVPMAGQPFTVICTNLPWPTSSAFLLVGGAPLPSPFDLAWFGAPGCAVVVAPTTSISMPNVIGFGSLTLPMPNLVGSEFYVQAAVFDAAANPLGITVSNACKGST